MEESKTVDGKKWLPIKEAAKKLGKTEKEVKDLIDSFHFIVNMDESFIDEQSLDEFMIDGRRHRLEGAMKAFQLDHVNELHRVSIEHEIESLDLEKAVDQDRKKELDVQLADVPKSKYTNDPFYKKHRGKVMLRTMHHHGLHFNSGEFITPVFSLFWNEILLRQSPTSDLNKYIGTPEQYATKQDRFNALAFRK